MIGLLALAGLLAGVAGARAVMSRADFGETWEEWQDGSPSRALFALSIVLVACFFAGFGGFGLPPEARVALIALPAGFCAVFFLEGVRRWRRGPKPDPARIPQVSRWGRWVGKDLPEDVRPDEWPPSPLWFAGVVAAFAVVGVVLGEGVGGVVVLALVGVWAVFLQSFGDQVRQSWLLRRDRRTWDDEPEAL